MSTYKLECRLCASDATFDSVEDAKASDWDEISPLGVHREECTAHNAYCPGHSLDGATE